MKAHAGKRQGIGLGVVLGLVVACGGAPGSLGEGAEAAGAAQTTRCVPVAAGGQPASGNQDAVTRLLGTATDCPRDVFELRARITGDGGALQTAFVDNRGFHNGAAGSFSLFETVTGSLRAAGIDVAPGEFFFGHFTAADGDVLVLDQEPGRGRLMVELIAWDPSKGFFNFFEMIGDGTQGRWFYRGDSGDILADTARLHRQVDPAHPQFGRTLRCSGCHVGGGPIMKELDAPHNDWWQATRPLPLGGLAPDARLAPLLRGLTSADALADRVHAGRARLEGSAPFAAIVRRRSLAEQLRPLFCPEEINFASDAAPDTSPAPVQVPSAFFVDPRLAPARSLPAPRAAYAQALAAARSAFPEAGRADADHAWLAPVKATADEEAVQALVDAGIIDDELVADVLAVDLTNPALSAGRCGLLRLLPADATPGWPAAFAAALAALADPFAQELHANLTDPARTAAAHRARAAGVVDACASQLAADVGALLPLLAQRRLEVAASEISKNPRGQILEPGFRVIFPTVAQPPAPGQWTLTDACARVPSP